jgi:hypothetical protein
MNRINTLATSSLIVALAFVAQACCGGLTKDEADQTLRVAINEAQVTGDAVEATNTNKLCGAEVIAHGDDGSELVLEEVEATNGCEYVAQGDSDVTYTISATHAEHGGGEDIGETNPACSVPTASEDIDNTLLLVKQDQRPDVALSPLRPR